MTKELFLAAACAKIWRIIDASPLLTKAERNVSQLWEKSHLLTHPFVRLDRGFVFIHVPKTAGTSLRKALGLAAPLNVQGHARARDVLPFIKLVAPHLISIAFVRDPFTRFLSLYTYAQQEESLYHSAKDPDRAPYGKHPDYDRLVNQSLEAAAELLVQGKLGDHRITLSHWQPQAEWLIDKEGKLAVDFVGHIETMDADMQLLKKLHGISSEPVAWLNKSEREEQRAPQFTPRAVELLQLYYKRDFEMFGYDETRVPGR
jgi:hypothetical protein